jgi:Fur family transcriptional regulator, peroxide stress response regulator
MDNTVDRLKQMVARLKELGHRMTPQRLAILEILAESKEHPSAEMVYEQLKERFPTMSPATVYKNISLLKETGEALELGFADGSNRYDGNKPYPHPHLICLACGSIIDPDLTSFQELTRHLTETTGYEISTYRIDFFGLCPTCQINGSKGRRA